jgi:predicted nuclease of predicted toxin-antitoxin system
MADSLILATAQEFNAILWTQDSDLKNINNVKYFPKKGMANKTMQRTRYAHR